MTFIFVPDHRGVRVNEKIKSRSVGQSDVAEEAQAIDETAIINGVREADTGQTKHVTDNYESLSLSRMKDWDF